jgi:hypothetical protein
MQTPSDWGWILPAGILGVIVAVVIGLFALYLIFAWISLPLIIWEVRRVLIGIMVNLGVIASQLTEMNERASEPEEEIDDEDV